MCLLGSVTVSRLSASGCVYASVESIVHAFTIGAGTHNAIFVVFLLSSRRLLFVS